MATSLDITLNPDVVCSTLPEGGVLLDLDTKQYFALNRSALIVWQHLEDGGSLGDVRAAIDPAAGAHLDSFVDALLEHGLALRAPEGDGRTAAAQPFGVDSWDAPTVTPHGRPLAQVILSPFESDGPHSGITAASPWFCRCHGWR
ncbi:MAG: PqqD family protein [Vicinamibacterales bacterium]